jgi:hypothetical protein
VATVGDVQVLALVAGIRVWIGTTLLLDAWWQRERRPDLAERLRPLLSDSIAEEARSWLDSRDAFDP